jgi:hypothetical protein
MRPRMSLTGSGAQPKLSSVTIQGSNRRTLRPLVWSSHDPAARTFFTQSLCGPVGEGEDVAIVGAEGVDGSAVGTAGLSTYMAHDGEPREVAGHLQDQAVGKTLVEASQASRCWHLTSSSHSEVTLRSDSESPC